MGGLCRACLTGDYPTPAGQRKYELALVEANKSKPCGNGCHRPAVPAAV